MKVEKFIQGLCSVSRCDFNSDNVLEFLAKNPLDANSLAPYLHFSKKFYTRNLIFRNEQFELMTLCWESGQISQIHDHANQNCWMSVPIGALTIENFRVVEHDPNSAFCRLSAAETFEISREKPASVDRDEPIHRVSNRFGVKSVSLHIYSKPIEHCNVFSINENTFEQVQLSYTSVSGKLCDGVEL